MRDGICDGVCFTQKPCLPSRLLHFTSANTVLSATSGFSAPRSQSSAGLAAFCFCVQIVRAQIPVRCISQIILQNHPIQPTGWQKEVFQPTISTYCLFCPPASVVPLSYMEFWERSEGKCIHKDLCRYSPEISQFHPRHQHTILPSPRRRFTRTCPLNRRPVSEDMAQTTERQGAGKTIKRPPCACTEGEAFRPTVRRQPGTAVSGSSLLDS